MTSKQQIKSALIDTNYIVALLNRKDPKHSACANAIKNTRADQWVTTWPVICESMYLLRSYAGLSAQVSLCDMIEDGTFAILAMPNIDTIRKYLIKYADLQVDFADASLAGAASESGISHIYTMDSDFRIINVPIESRKVMNVIDAL